MRRLQANLAYLAALADRKPSVPVPPCPAYLSSPPLNLSLRIRNQAGAEGENKSDPMAEREERDRAFKEMYTKLQALFPGIDPKKEPTFPPAAARQPPPGAQSRSGSGQGMKTAPNRGSPPADQSQKTPQMANATAPAAAQSAAS
jgi:hypothetical protein